MCRSKYVHRRCILLSQFWLSRVQGQARLRTMAERRNRDRNGEGRKHGHESRASETKEQKDQLQQGSVDHDEAEPDYEGQEDLA
ncbi:hypothetical protein L596_019580 [Steinernema carpocapsae]|uniref:Uncharacterized protein n=1 Tax=Steinernema carpocapsae TaxID=34508 RepID=A0A4U5MR21_STECR|nr:hypothetical protein L596_019580 [Steinernema carpocapsae]